MRKIKFPLPFIEFEGFNPQGDAALTLVDLRMIELSYLLRGKPLWWTKIKDPAIRSQWKTEALARKIRGAVLRDAEIEYVLDELEDYALMKNESNGIQPSCHFRVWESDALVSQELRTKLKLAAAALENVPEEEKDWHPRAYNQVLDLVDPSLFCTIYERDQESDTSNDGLKRRPLYDAQEELQAWTYSERFSWIPTDFQLGKNGVPATALGYINNVHPKHKDLITVIESLVGRFSLLWDKVLTDIHPANKDGLPRRGKVVGSYEWTDHPDHPFPDEDERWEEDYNSRLLACAENRIVTQPTVDKRGYRGSGENIRRRKRLYSTQGKVVQVIVKLENIHLTPEQPKYPGGETWLVEGMANERIVASGIYCYDSENITDGKLAFRMGINFEGVDGYKGSDSKGIELTWGMEPGGQSYQIVGRVKTFANRCIAFPNIYQHHVSSFKLVDPTKPGRRKMVALYLVDPETRIPSTSNVAPNQRHWIHDVISETLAQHPHSRKVALPAEVIDMVLDELGNLMTLEEAKEYRLELLDERAAFMDILDEQYIVSDSRNRD
ncbi:hypothetical protein FS837_000530 [Tulasnella sp. UAMH 9824]|nr:hypothetical protein FS837_000530 [Tulasnella sp. UAMH 9824]